MSAPKPNSNWQALFKGENVTYWGLIWSAIALVLYLTFSVVESGTTRPAWYIATTTGMEEIGLFVAGSLCWRNWQSHHIPNGRGIWLLFAIATFAFGMGNLWFALWELLWGLEPAASAGNPWFVLFYLMLIAGVRLAILDRDVRLATPQWMIVASVAACGLILGCWLTTGTAKAELMPPVPLRGSLQQEVTLGSRNFVAANSPPLSRRQSTAPIRQPQTRTPTVHQTPPGWVLAIDRAMQPLVTSFNLFYILCDLILLIFATILFLGFWGGNLGSTWRTIAQAVLCFYIADTWFAYAHNQVQGYESGFIMEVFWIFGIVQFGIAAALEFDNSIRARRLDRRRTAIK